MLGQSLRSVHHQAFISYAPAQSSAGVGRDVVGQGKAGPAGIGEADLCASLGKGARPAKRAGQGK